MATDSPNDRPIDDIPKNEPDLAGSQYKMDAANPNAMDSLLDRDEPRESEVWKTIEQILKPIASFRVTIVLFSLAIFVVFVGTLAQARMGLWEAVHRYFRSAFVKIDFEVFFPPAFFPNIGEVNGFMFFPGGWLIGTLLAINLLAASVLRFKVTARGPKLAYGLLVTLAGALVTLLVIWSGSSESGVHYTAEFSWDKLWWVFLALLGLSSTACGVAAGFIGVLMPAPSTNDAPTPPSKSPLFWLCVAGAIVLGILFVWLTYLHWKFPGGAGRLNNASMRILWQLAKSTAAAVVLGAGCWMLFGRRGGIVLMHTGILMLMFGEVLVGMYAQESYLTVREGETVNYIHASREFELSIVDTSNELHDEVVVVPHHKLIAAERRNGKDEPAISHDLLPFNIEVVQYHEHSTVRALKETDDNPATAGHGTVNYAQEAEPVAGTQDGSNIPSVYVRFKDKESGDSLGVYLVSLILKDQQIKVGDKAYTLAFRNKRTYAPYSMYLYDVRGDNYIGTNIPNNYSSKLQLVDESRGENRSVDIRMNSPLRYGGQTFYQSGYQLHENHGVESTTLQVVDNSVWMIPYVACQIVAVGMMVQFTVVLNRYLKRRAKESAALLAMLDAAQSQDEPKSKKHRRSQSKKRQRQQEQSESVRKRMENLAPILVIVVTAGLLAVASTPRKPKPDKMDYREFGKLPVVFEGRVKPIDTLARNSLVAISAKQSYKELNGKTQPAVRWLLEVATNPERANKYKVFRIQNLDLLEVLGLERRKGFRYSFDEFKDRLPELIPQLKSAANTEEEDRTVFQRKALEFKRRLDTYNQLLEGFQEVSLPPRPTPAEFRKNPEAAAAKDRAILDALLAAKKGRQRVMSWEPPRLVPMKEKGERYDEGEEEWLPYSVAWPMAYTERELLKGQATTADAALSLKVIFDAFRSSNAPQFNQAVAAYQQQLDSDRPDEYTPSKMRFESLVNYAQPFLAIAIIYLLAFLVSCFSWLGLPKLLNRTALGLVVFALAYHTVALAVRMYISGRPPVTNLYSSAIFIAWGVVVLGLVFEVFHRKGVGLAVAAAVGFLSLLVAHFLASRGDTITVMRAVLDTGFWLATHVVAIAIGYCATFMAGGLGVAYIIMGVFTPVLKPEVEKEVTRMTYGTLCFAIFFSFVGTVLGGLWADDSWGRFWGWDPKENGALIIVLWNALVLHARFGGLVKDRGLAVLAVAGNIVTAWSWFGTNELRVGLHSYGFTEGVLLALGIFVLTQIGVIITGCLPKSLWWSFREEGALIAESVET